MRKTKITIIMLLIYGLIGCSEQQRTAQNVQSGSITVAATFFPLYDLTKRIIGDKGIVYSIVPSGTEPHDYEPTPSDIQKLNDAYAFVTIGIEFKEFEDGLIKAVNQNIKVIHAENGISLLKKGREHSGNDPHIWLSPRNAQKMAINIMNGLTEADPDNAQIYLKNGQNLIEQLEFLDKEFKEGLAACKKEVILVNHNAFAYLASEYAFRTIAISGLEPEAEPTPQQLANLIEEANEYGIKYVLYEELVDPRVSNTIAREVGAEVLELSPLEGSPDTSDTYLSLMRKNLNNLKIALECP